MFESTEILEIFADEDYLTGDILQRISAEFEEIIYLKTDSIYKDIVWRGERVTRAHRDLVKGKVVLSGHSDIAMTKIRHSYLKWLGAKSIFSTNLQTSATGAHVAPLGLSNNWETAAHVLCGDIQPFIDSLNTNPFEINPSQFAFYVNFSSGTYSKIRTPLLSYLKENTLGYPVKMDNTEFSSEGRKRYISNIARFKLVICPRGNGRDTHRFWEALYAGSIPVVVESEIPYNLLNQFDLPVVRLKSWGDLKYKSLIEPQIHQILQQKHNSDALRSSKFMTQVRANARK